MQTNELSPVDSDLPSGGEEENAAMYPESITSPLTVQRLRHLHHVMQSSHPTLWVRYEGPRFMDKDAGGGWGGKVTEQGH